MRQEQRGGDFLLTFFLGSLFTAVMWVVGDDGTSTMQRVLVSLGVFGLGAGVVGVVKMRSRVEPLWRWLLVLMAIAFVAIASPSGFSWLQSELRPRPLAEWYDLSGVSIGIGSKEFTEQRVLGQIAIQVLRAAGADVTEQLDLGGTQAVRAALEDNQIDGYYGYTGTAWMEIFGHDEPIKGVDPQLEAVRNEDEDNGYTWLAPSAASNTYAIAANEAAVDKHGPVNISDYASIASQNPEAAALCASREFVNRPDGLPGLEERYGFDLPDKWVTTLNSDEIYRAAGEGKRCQFAAVFSTAGGIVSQNLTILEDDLNFFPHYNIAMVLRTGIYEGDYAEEDHHLGDHPEGPHPGDYGKLFGEIARLLTDERLREMNSRVEAGEGTEEEVARKFLERWGII